MRSDRLQRLIELKERLMEEKERLLERYFREKDNIVSNIEVLDNEGEKNYHDLCTKCLEGNEFTSIRDYIEHLGRLKISALTAKHNLEKQIAAVRHELYEMLKEIKVLNTLKEKIVASDRRAENKKHQKLIDEIALRLDSTKT